MIIGRIFKPSIFRGVIIEALKQYKENIRPLLVATFLPLLLIGTLRMLTDDRTGEQYNVLIALLGVFSSMVLVRIAVAGWDWRKVKLLSFYNGIMARYLSVLGLSAAYVLMVLPAVGAIILAGVALIGELPRWVLIPVVPVGLLGGWLIIWGSFALYALMDDMELTVFQAFRVSGKLAVSRRWALLRLVGILLAIALIAGVLLYAISQWLPEYFQDPQFQLVLDGFINWLVAPVGVCLIAAIYRRLVENYES
ncbi:hypothetical protein KBC99_00260 [Candidatus Saccharibacteria bacterium]|nr:hypothetical protein [Candidatus Saccharibacteria bacterium]